MADSRKIAAQGLRSVLFEEKYSNLVFNELVSKYGLKGVDKSFASALFYGSLDRLNTLDFVINLFAKQGVKSLPPYTAAVLRIAVYQLLYMDKVPESAAVNEAVNSVKRSKENRCSGIVNGILRSIIRERERVDNLINDKPCLKFSCPEPIYESLVNDYGQETADAVVATFVKTPKIYLRVNTVKTTAEELVKKLDCDAQIIDETTVSLSGGLDFENNECYLQGLFHVQGLSSQLSAFAAARGKRILDVCAAPGGKSFTIAEILSDNCEVVSCDIHPHRVELIKNGARRLGLKSIVPMVNDASKYNADLGTFDSVLCDVPCSGLGVISHKPEIKLHALDESLSEIQYDIITASSKYVKSGGRLVYSTCTLRRAENEDITAKFLAENPDFCPDTTSFNDKTFFEHKDKTDGFFISVFLRK